MSRKQETLNRLDPRAPLVIDTRELGRRPGCMRRVSRLIPAPDSVGNAVLSVPRGSDVELDVRLEAVMEGVLVSGTVRARAEGDCVRCLDPVRRDIEAALQELFVYADRYAEAYAGSTPGATGADDEPDEVYRLDGDLLDLGPPVRDALVLALPLQPTCGPDCPGLCVSCGARLADDSDHAHDEVDPRWAALAALAAGVTTTQTLNPQEK